jgi:CHAT domain-containing protein/Tfp pilus assembly protein PilF
MLRRRHAHLLYVLILVAPSLVSLTHAQEDHWKELDTRADELYKKGKYEDALAAAQDELRLSEATFGPESLNLATALNRLGKVYESLNSMSEATAALQRALAIREKALGSDHPDVAESLCWLAHTSWEQGKYADAEQMYRRSLAIREKALGPDHPDVAESLDGLAEVYSVKGRFDEAEPLYRRGLAIREKTLGPEDPEVAQSLMFLGQIMSGYHRKYPEAELLFRRALTIDEKALGPDHPDLADALSELGRLYQEEGKYAEAEPLFQRAMAVLLRSQHPFLAGALKELATLYEAEGKYPSAEPLLKQAVAIEEKVFGPNNMRTANAYSLLAQLYQYEGSNRQAEPLFQNALAIYEKELGPEHPYVASARKDLARLYQDEGKYLDAEPLLQQALATYEKALGTEHPSVAAALGRLAALYDDEGKYAKAEPLAERALAILEKVRGPEHPDVAPVLVILGRAYAAEGGYAKAELLYQRALALYEHSLGPDHPSVAKASSALAGLYFAEGKYAEAEPLFDRSLENLTKQFERYFVYMSEKDRLEFLDTVSNLFPVYFSFCQAAYERTPQVAGKMYDVLLWEKGLVASSIASLQSRVAAGGNQETLALFQKLAVNRARIAALAHRQPKDPEERRKTIAQLEEESNDLEEQVAQRSAPLGEGERLTRARWKDIRGVLGEHDAAVEIVRFHLHDGRNFVDKSFYAALIVTRRTEIAPTLVLLGNAAKFEHEYLLKYRAWAARSAQVPGSALYEMFWKPLEKSLAGSQRIYLSPDGILNEVSLGIIPTPRGLLVERYDLRIVSSTRDLLREPTTPKSNYAVLVGDPAFSMTDVEERAAAAQTHKTVGPTKLLMASTGDGMRSRDSRAQHLSPLPGTSLELRRIGSVLKRNDWTVETYTGKNALVKTVKGVEGPRVLHLATHGFFLLDQEGHKRGSLDDTPTGSEEPMLRSGLYFAGANRTLLRRSADPELNDGILTAYEASELNLEGTELVVLSACETGLGQVKNGEGVLGLRRAFQEAGAESVLMSLWSVPDRETQELMELFYKYWLSGQEKPAALRLAQIELRKMVKARYGQDQPFYWGGFVLVGK